MGYEILSNDLFDDGDEGVSKKGEKKKFKISGIYIHIIILLLIIIPLFIYFYANFDNFFDNESNKELFNLNLVGDLEDFNISYTGNIGLNSGFALFQTKTSEFKVKNEFFNISNFSGRIYLFNESIVFDGIGEKVIFGDNKVLLNGDRFKLISIKKSNFDLNLENLKLVFLEGKLLLDDVLSFNMKNSSVFINGYNVSISYDGTFSFDGVFNSFNLKSFEDKLNLEFENFDKNKNFN